ncbi:MAG: hypothetical protein DRJ03_30070 [Chloroflexi bacterium]|nr:MAG: hypothetical protein DRJ03_30070 [Chloroflexota bacterium]
MNKKDEKIFKHLMQQYKIQYDLNGYNRDNYDENLEYYLSYRNSQEYPLAFNESFNKILPIIYTILSRFMDQMYQTSNIVSVKPRKNKDINNAKSVEAVLNYQLESLNNIDNQGGSYLTMMKWFFNALTFGKGIVKCYWKKEERISPKRLVLPIPEFDGRGNLVGMRPYDHLTQEMQIAYDGPYVEVLHNKLFVPHPNYRSIAKMPAVFLVYSRSIDYIKKMANKGVYKNIKELGFESTGGAGHHPTDSTEAWIKSIGIEGGIQIDDINSEQTTPEVDVIEAYTKLILKDNPYEVGSGIKIKGLEEEAIIHIGNYKTILSIQRNTYGVRPLFDIGCYMHPEMYWDVGLVRLTKGIQKQIDNMANLRMQNAFMQINQMIRVDPNSDVDPESLVWRPFGIVPAMEGEVEALTVPDYNSNIFAEQMSFFDSTIQDLTGMYDYNMGQTPKRQERVGVVYSLQAMGEARAKLMLMSMDYLGIRPLLKHMMLLNTFHLPSGFEFRVSDGPGQQFNQIFGQDIHSDFDYAARYTAMEPALGKQARGQQLVQMAPLMQQNPWINQYQWTKTLLELADVRESEQLLKQPQQFAQEMQQQQQAAMMAEQLKEKLEGDKKIRVSDKDFQEQLVLNEQEHGHNLALAALEGELANEKSAE